VVHKAGPWIGRVKATLQTRAIHFESKEKCVVDVTFVNEVGEVLGEALGIETHVIAASDTASPPTPIMTVV
jgi:hypothetical protein